jgi:hypothetical protein
VGVCARSSVNQNLSSISDKNLPQISSANLQSNPVTAYSPGNFFLGEKKRTFGVKNDNFGDLKNVNRFT